MTLYEYLKEKNIKLVNFANVTHIPVSSLYRVWKGKHDPSYRRGKAIETATGGQVTWDKI